MVTSGNRFRMVSLQGDHLCGSWAMLNGGVTVCSQVAWYEVCREELPMGMDPDVLLHQRMSVAGHNPDITVAMMTSRLISAFLQVSQSLEGMSATCYATVGLSNALRVGDKPGMPPVVPGTINILCQLSHPLTSEATIEALSIAAEARTLAIVEWGGRSKMSGAPATGTGTDCIVIASPVAEKSESEAIPFAGKHTTVGHLIGKSVYEAIQKGAQNWQFDKDQGILGKPRNYTSV